MRRSDSGKGVRRRLVELAARWGITTLLEGVHNRRRSSLLVLAYHRVLQVEDPDSYPFDPELIIATPEEFAWQMRYLREHMQPVSLSEVVQHLDDGTALPRRAVAVTFDDGFVDTYRNAFPVLRELHMPATVFATTGYVDSPEPFWFELVAYLMMRIPPWSIRVQDSAHAFPLGPSLDVRRVSIHMLQEILKGLPDARRTNLIKEWSRSFAGRIDPAALELGRPLTWAQVSEMAAAGIEFGSHTVTHPNLTRLEEPSLLWELADSKSALERRLGHEIKTLAYPIGTRSAYDTRVMDYAKRAGFRLAVSYVAGVNWMRELERFELRRQGVSPDISRAWFRAMTTLPAWIG